MARMNGQQIAERNERERRQYEEDTRYVEARTASAWTLALQQTATALALMAARKSNT